MWCSHPQPETRRTQILWSPGKAELEEKQELFSWKKNLKTLPARVNWRSLRALREFSIRGNLSFTKITPMQETNACADQIY